MKQYAKKALSCIFFITCGLASVESVYAVLRPLLIKTTSRKKIYEVTMQAPNQPKITYYELRVWQLKPTVVDLSSNVVGSIVNRINSEKSTLLGNVVDIDLKRSSVVRAKQVHFIVPAGSYAKQYLKFVRTPRNERIYYMFEAVGNPVKANNVETTDDKIQVKIKTVMRYIGTMIPAKPKPYPKFRVKEKNGRLYFRNKASRYSMAYLSCKNNEGKEMTYRLLVPSNKKAVNKRAMSWDLKDFIKKKRAGENMDKFSCQAVYYKRLGSDKKSARKKLLTL